MVGIGKRGSPSKLPYSYNVLGHFHVTDVWCEKNTTEFGTFKHWMVRLEKTDLKEKSWWAPAFPTAPLSVRLAALPKIEVVSRECKVCAVSSKEILNQGWTCLNSSCVNHFVFFKYDNGIEEQVIYHETSLDYNQGFLNERTKYQGSQELVPLSTPLPTSAECVTGFEERCKKGIVCGNCGCCIRRIHWAGWECEVEGCGWTYTVTQQMMTASMARIDQKPDKTPNFVNFPITKIQTEIGIFSGSVYSLPGPAGYGAAGHILILEPSDFANTLPDGPDQIFAEMQANSIGMKRRPVRQASHKGEVITAHWSTNVVCISFCHEMNTDLCIGYPIQIFCSSGWRDLLRRCPWCYSENPQTLDLGWSTAGKLQWRNSGTPIPGVQRMFGRGISWWSW